MGQQSLFGEVGVPPGVIDWAMPRCAVCGKACEVQVRREGAGEVLGCEHCTKKFDAWEVAGDDMERA